MAIWPIHAETGIPIQIVLIRAAFPIRFAILRQKLFIPRHA